VLLNDRILRDHSSLNGRAGRLRRVLSLAEFTATLRLRQLLIGDHLEVFHAEGPNAHIELLG